MIIDKVCPSCKDPATFEVSDDEMVKRSFVQCGNCGCGAWLHLEKAGGDWWCVAFAPNEFSTFDEVIKSRLDGDSRWVILGEVRQ